MIRAVVDASAVLALINRESGWERAEVEMSAGAISAVNLTEVVTKLLLIGATSEQVEEAWSALNLQIEPLDTARAVAAGLLVLRTRRLGLSLADRACLALAIELNIPAVTADRAWSKLDLPVEIRVIR
jgi:PIN domain nuclease of toxin-antitoxin system